MVHRRTSVEPDYLSVELVAICAIGKALETLEDPEARKRVLRWANERYQLESTNLSPAAAPLAGPPHASAIPALRLAVASAPDVPLLRLASGPEHEAPLLRLAPAREVDDVVPDFASGLESEFEPQVGLAIELEFEPEHSRPGHDLRVDNLEDLFEPARGDASPAPIVEAGLLFGGTDDPGDLDEQHNDLDDLSDLYEHEPPSDEIYEAPMEICELPLEPARPQLHLVTREEQPFEQLIDDLVDNLQRLSEECLDA